MPELMELDTPIFPDPPAITVERTLAIIKPDAIDQAEEIIEEIKRQGFTILQQRRLRLSPEQASDLYAEQYGKMFFPSLIAYMHSLGSPSLTTDFQHSTTTLSDDIIALVLAKPDAITEWRELLGPTNAARAKQEAPDTLRARYGTDQTRNGLHGSDSFLSAEREIKFMFPEAIIEPITHGQSARDYLQKRINPILTKGLTELCKRKPEDPVTWLAEWLLENNPNKPQVQET